MSQVIACMIAALLVQFTFVSTETYYTTPSLSIPCPEEGVPCLTLSQYAAKPNSYFASNTTLIILPGNHSLDSELRITNITCLNLFANTASVSDTTITCSQSSGFTFKYSDCVYIRGLTFARCVGSIISVKDQVTIEDCKISGENYNETGLELKWINTANIVKSAFILNTGKKVLNPYPLTGFVTEGGAITANNSKISIKSSWFERNSGGAVYIWHSVGPNIIDNCTFVNNFNVRAVYAERSVITIYCSRFINSRADDYDQGGAVGAGSSIVTINSSTFANNTAEFGGGAVFASRSSNITIDNTTFIDNCAYQNGAVSAQDSAVAIDSSTFVNNMANTGGGAIGTLNSTVLIDSSTFANNVAAGGSGGALRGDTYSGLDSRPGTTCAIRNSIFLNNTASTGGGAVSTDDYSTILDIY